MITLSQLQENIKRFCKRLFPVMPGRLMQFAFDTQENPFAILEPVFDKNSIVDYEFVLLNIAMSELLNVKQGCKLCSDAPVRKRLFTLCLESQLPETSTRKYIEMDDKIYYYTIIPIGDGLLALTITDITALQNLANEAAQANVESELSKRQLQIIKEFAHDINHDIKTPLSVIKTTAYILGAKNLAPDEQVDIIKTQVNRVSQIIDDLMQVVELSDNNDTLHKEDLKINSVTLDVVAGCRQLAEAKKQSFVYKRLREASPIIPIDTDRLFRALSNIVINAINYTEVGGKIVIEEFIEERINRLWFVFSVNDTGIGLSEEDQKKIFERFYRVDSSRTSLTGVAGLGLSITKKVIELHEGFIEVKSELGVGSTFNVYLPINK